ncbi:ATP-binding protein [Aestuariivita sp.]|uniref:sensor histidine kinase n=1 Tax=Aestuariivita sp. TaxID=1872407 RepID=UPI00216CD02A|nr:ATP-binding protein [Aestuariivita sp.]MCE8006341.1 histidine kinase [Aestuariivita sp.]
MFRSLHTPAARLSVLFAVAATAMLVVCGLTIYGQDRQQNVSGLSALWQQDFRFWVQILTGMGAFLIAAWIWALKPRNPDVTLFALSGLATMTFTFAYAPLGGVGVVMPAEVLVPLYRVNALGASLFGIVMTVLLLRYPVRLPFHQVLTAAAVVGFGGWTVAALLGPVEGLMIIHTITFLEMLCMITAVIGQYFATRRFPKERAIAIWLGISIIVGSGIFIALVAAPIALGLAPLVDERFAFSSFLLVYIGMAVGLTRYRVFELGEWAFYVLFYVAGAILLITIDIALIFLLSWDARASLGLSLLLVALVYLPTRDVFWRSLFQRKRMQEHELFQSIFDVAFEPDRDNRNLRWGELFNTLFEPLELVMAENADPRPVIRDDGVTLFVPATAAMPAMVLRHPWRGRGLFGPRHLRTAQHLVDIMSRAEEGRRAYDLGVAEERTRIARDMHDNIGAQLMSALHSPALERKDLMIGQTLSDLRDIIRNATRPGLPVEEALADLRAETAERFEPTGITLNWEAQGQPDTALAPDPAHALRSLVREGVSNIIRHSSARSASVHIDYRPDQITVQMTDDGRGLSENSTGTGSGLQSMHDRVRALDGTFEIRDQGTGTSITATFPLSGQVASGIIAGQAAD